MKNYHVITPQGATVHSGVLRLTKEQAGDRSHVLKKIKDGIYELTGSTQFKLGESFGWDGESNKQLMTEVAFADGDKSKSVALAVALDEKKPAVKVNTDPSKMNVAELKELAEKGGIILPENATKKQILTALEAKKQDKKEPETAPPAGDAEGAGSGEGDKPEDSDEESQRINRK